MFTPRGEGARPLRSRRGGRSGIVLRRVLAVVVVLAVLATLAAVAWRTANQPRDEPVRAKPRPVCSTPAPLPPAAKPRKVKVNVFNATDRRGLAAKVAGRLDKRGFRVGKVDNDPLGRTVTGAAEVRHGAAGASAARTVASQLGAAHVVTVPDERKGAVVDLVLGSAFEQLASPAAAEAVLTQTPAPSPAGCRRR